MRLANVLLAENGNYTFGDSPIVPSILVASATFLPCLLGNIFGVVLSRSAVAVLLETLVFGRTQDVYTESASQISHDEGIGLSLGRAGSSRVPTPCLEDRVDVS